MDCQIAAHTHVSLSSKKRLAEYVRRHPAEGMAPAGAQVMKDDLCRAE
jgi:hypothetical protein